MWISSPVSPSSLAGVKLTEELRLRLDGGVIVYYFLCKIKPIFTIKINNTSRPQTERQKTKQSKNNDRDAKKVTLFMTNYVTSNKICFSKKSKEVQWWKSAKNGNQWKIEFSKHTETSLNLKQIDLCLGLFSF